MEIRNGNGNKSKWRESFEAFHAEMDHQLYAPDFLTSLDAVMRDKTAAPRERCLAWAKRGAWGNQCRFVVDKPIFKGGGLPLPQKDCAAELELDPAVVCRAFQELRSACLVQIDDHGRIFPALYPQQGLPLPKTRHTGEWTEFLKEVELDSPDDYYEYQQAEAAVRQAKRHSRTIRSALLKKYRAWKKLRGSTIAVDDVNNSRVDGVNGSLRQSAIAAPDNPPENHKLTELGEPVTSNVSSTAANVKKSPPPPIGSRNANCPTDSQQDVATVLKAFREFNCGDRDIAAETLQECRRRPAGRECTGEDVAKQVRKRGPEARNKKHPAAWLKAAVPPAFDDDGWRVRAAPAPHGYKYYDRPTAERP